MASVSSATSSLGNTSLRGYGGMASGIDRDGIIEQMTLGTTTKIENKRKEITSTEWKQEAYRDVINKIIDMEDKYYTFSSTESLLNSSFFGKNQVSAVGDSSVTKYISASGSSSMLNYMSILGVSQMATASTLKSGAKGGVSSITTGIAADRLNTEQTRVSNLAGKKLEFGFYAGAGNIKDKWQDKGSFTFPTTYTKRDADGNEETITIDYTNKDNLSEADYLKKLEGQLNEALQYSSSEIDGEKISDVMEFKLADGKLQMQIKDSAPEEIKKNLKIRESSSALGALGFDANGDDFSTSGKRGVSFDEFNSHSDNFMDSAIQKRTLADYMTGKKLSVTFAGQTKDIELVTADELQAIKDCSGDSEAAMNKLVSNIQSRLDRAFGTNNLEVCVEEGNLAFKLGSKVTDNLDPDKLNEAPTLTITSSSAEVRNTLGIQANASNKISLDASLYDNREKLGIDDADIQAKIPSVYDDLKAKYDDLSAQYEAWKNGLDGTTPDDVEDADKPDYVKEFEQLQKDLSDKGIEDLVKSGKNYSALNPDEQAKVAEALHKDAFNEVLQEMSINGVTGKDLKITANTTVNQFMNALNKNADAGVKATYLSATNEFVLLASETGSGRTFELEGAAKSIFGDPEGNGFKGGQNAKMEVSYGNGITTTMESSTNTFDVDGLKVTVSGEFGYTKDADGNIVGGPDTSKAVTFNAKADVDAATERVKKFIEAYNELVDKISSEMTTKPDSDYGPLTDAQKDEMDDTSIENWEKKAKQGLLFGDSYLRELSNDVQMLQVSMLKSGIKTDDLESIGISFSSDWYEGGKLVFDESKFRQAMNDDPDKVANLISGGGDVKTGLAETIGNKLSNYATRLAYKHNGSYGTLVEVAGSDKISSSLQKNQIYDQLKRMQEDLEKLKSLLTTEQDRYIKQFTTMETLISQMNSQSSYLSSLSVG
ncbi:MAG: flagellar filament capping protein FliD [Lachnospiraceae bacterium]|nr:flagellar filament capping protein FliD [Lachnospiraceae bacterium]